MFLGHFALAMATTRVAPKASLGTLVLSAQFADCLWPALLLLRVEQVRIAPGITRVTPLDFVSYPISHSLLMQLVWGLLLGAIYFSWRRDSRTAMVVGALLPTHWLLDYFSHRPDLPLYPGGPKVGLGMWHSLPLTLVAEFGLFAAGVVLYWRATPFQRSMEFRFLVIDVFSRLDVSRFGVWPAAAECSRACVDRAGVVADDSLGGLG